MSATNKIDQKEYLKKYLSGDSSEKKKKKKKKPKEVKGKTVTIVDDDIDLSRIHDINNDNEIEEAVLMNEDAPVIVGVIDDRPAELKALDYKNKMWRGLNEVNDKNSKDLSPKRPERKRRTPDFSPKRRNKRSSSRDFSPKRKSRRSKSRDFSPKRKPKQRTPDYSPKRKPMRSRSRDLSPKRQRKSRFTDASPVQRRRSPSSDLSPSRVRKDLDLSPVRKKRSSPVNSRYRSPDLSPQRRNRKRTPDLSPRRARQDLDLSPDRKRKTRKYSRSPTRNRIPSPRAFKNPQRKLSESPPPTHAKKMTKTMDGKMAGLQNATSLKSENAKHSKREAEMYEKMSEEMSGRNAEARVRATGAVDRRKLEANLAKEREREAKYAERKQVYDVWGKGLAQVEAYKSHLEEAARDASKPFARYAGDEDVERHLKEQERLEDPMLEYMRAKKKKQEIKDKVASKPVYKGLYPDNRFNIRPGYRWDGVDRSNGYEKKHFEAINVRKATEEEAYLYSTEDM